PGGRQAGELTRGAGDVRPAYAGDLTGGVHAGHAGELLRVDAHEAVGGELAAELDRRLQPRGEAMTERDRVALDGPRGAGHRPPVAVDALHGDRFDGTVAMDAGDRTARVVRRAVPHERAEVRAELTGFACCRDQFPGPSPPAAHDRDGGCRLHDLRDLAAEQGDAL